jgi:hypothetical protein
MHHSGIHLLALMSTSVPLHGECAAWVGKCVTHTTRKAAKASATRFGDRRMPINDPAQPNALRIRRRA